MSAKPQSIEASQRSARLPWIDPIKGLAILGIMLYHIALPLFGVPPFDHPKDDWLPLVERLAQLRPWPSDDLVAYVLLNVLRGVGWLGYQGVHLFLILSGFGLTWAQINRAPDADVNVRQFLKRRVWRVFPIFWAGHFFFVLFRALTGEPNISVLDSRFYLSLTTFRLLPDIFYYISPAWWYVWLILQLYVVFPFLWAWLRRRGLLHFWLGTAIITLLSRFVLLIIVGSNREMWSMGALFVTRLSEFTFGMGLAYWLARQPGGLKRLWRKRWPLAIASLTYLLALALSFTVAGSIVAHSLIAVSLFGMTYALTQSAILAVKRLGQLTAWLGKQSYGLFILHQPILWWFMPLGIHRIQPYWLFLALLALVSILIILGSAAFSAAVEHASNWVVSAFSALWLMERRGEEQRSKRIARVGMMFGISLLGIGWLVGLAGCFEQHDRWIHTNVTYLGETHDVNVYLPEDYPEAGPYPVVYLLHGWPENPERWQRPDVESQADHCKIVLVAVEGDDDDITPSWYSRQTKLPYPNGSNWHVSFYDWFFDGVLPWVEANYSVRTDPGGRAIVGFSMGGKGALSLAGHRPDLFTAVVAIAGVMDLRDYADRYEIPDVYGPLAGNELRYAADSPIELAPNLKGLSITLLHGAEDTYWIHYEQSRQMSQRLSSLGYPHQWEEIPGQDHDPLTTYEITRTFESLVPAFEMPYSPPAAWRYRFADDTTRQVYSTTLTKTNPLTWTEIMSVTEADFETASGDPFSLTTATVYKPLASYIVTSTNLLNASLQSIQVRADEYGRLTLSLPAGRHRVDISDTVLSDGGHK